MYPAMIAEALTENENQALRSFQYANEVEKVHAALYQQALDALETKGELYDFYLCPVCGHTVAKEAPETCVVCGAKGSVFFKVS